MKILDFKKKFETIKLKLRRKYINLTASIRKNKIFNHNFSIISNNCWGGFIYQSYSLRYNSPTIGSFFVAEDYIKFIKNFREYIDLELTEVLPKESKWFNELNKNSSFGKYPIGKLNDIEIHFLHYGSFVEAKKTWDKRKKRINYKNILFKFSEMNCCTEKHIKEFQDLALDNKICFVTKKYKHLANDYTFVVSNQQKLTASSEPFGKSKKVNINKIINKLI